jgi:hypothetical protein
MCGSRKSRFPILARIGLVSVALFFSLAGIFSHSVLLHSLSPHSPPAFHLPMHWSGWSVPDGGHACFTSRLVPHNRLPQSYFRHRRPSTRRGPMSTRACHHATTNPPPHEQGKGKSWTVRSEMSGMAAAEKRVCDSAIPCQRGTITMISWPTLDGDIKISLC